MTSRAPGLTRLNTADEQGAAALLHEVCASRAWNAALRAGRPYATVGDLLAANDRAVAALDPAGLAEAVAGHPPIGRPRPGDPVSSREQRGVRPEQRERLLELGRRYEERHGYAFVICATGRTGDQMLAALAERTVNPPETEREIVRGELGRINRIRLTRLAEEGREAGDGVRETGGSRSAAQEQETGAGPGFGNAPDVGAAPGSGNAPDVGAGPGFGNAPDAGEDRDASGGRAAGTPPGAGSLPDPGARDTGTGTGRGAP